MKVHPNSPCLELLVTLLRSTCQLLLAIYHHKWSNAFSILLSFAILSAVMSLMNWGWLPSTKPYLISMKLVLSLKGKEYDRMAFLCHASMLSSITHISSENLVLQMDYVPQ